MNLMKPLLTPAMLIILLFLTFSCRNEEKVKTKKQGHSALMIDSLFNSAVNNNEIPGASVYISRQGREVYYKSFGYRNMQSRDPMKRDDIFRMASMTKGLTAVAILQLCERGLLFLDDEVSDYIPEFREPVILTGILPDSGFTSRPSSRVPTIRELLTHTSGIGYGFQDEKYNALVIKNKISEGFCSDDRTSLENIRRIAKLPLLCEPGEKYIYGLSYDVLAVVVEKVSGMRFDRYIKQNILDPLEMKESYFIVPDREQYRLVTPYRNSESSNTLELTSYPDTVYPRIKTRQYFSGGADLCSTAGDYANFIRMILHKGSFKDKRILGSRYIEMMLSKQIRFDSGSSDEGFAAWVTNKTGAAEGPMSEGSFGFGGFWDTYGWADPGRDFVAVLLLQMYPPNKYRIHEKFRAITYAVIDDL
jgi:CubicO group peptidase (beta-lactamase class C family)